MADAKLQILIQARNNAKGEFDALNKQVKGLQGTTGGFSAKLGELDSKFKSVTGVSLGFASAAGLAGAAISGLTKFIKDSVNETVDYATSIDSMSRLLGISTEDTSRLVQATDDLFISQEKLSSALMGASRRGIDVSIDGLKGLSEQYLALPEGIERAQFLMQTFGRSGAEMGKLMEVGAEGIETATAAIADNLVMTEQSIAEIMNYKRSVDNMNDSWQGFKYTIGSDVIPALDLLFRNLTKGTDEVEVFLEQQRGLEQQIYAVRNAFLRSKEWRIESEEELQAQLDALRDGFYGVEDSANDAGSSLYGLGDSIIPVSAYLSELTKQMLFNQAAAGLDAAASLELAEAMGMVSPNTKFALDALGRFRDMLDTGQISLDEYNALVVGLSDNIAGLKDKTVTITVNTRYAGEFGGIGGAERAAGVDLNGNGIIGKAQGGLGSGRTLVGEYGPEIVDLPQGSFVHSNMDSRNMTGNKVINFYYSPAISLSDKAEAEMTIRPMLEEILRG